ncbi:MAG: N-acetyltransferase [Paraprevotella sp.]|nr:N-acetyltransferase [Paraprevotella sp.]
MEIIHDEAGKQFKVEVDGHTAYVAYRLTADNGLDIRHTIVPDEIGGRGIASALVKAAYDYARGNGLKPIATCSYAAVWLQRHPEYQGETSSDYCEDGACAL